MQFICYCLVIVIALVQGGMGSLAEKNLLDHLLENSNPLVRPALNASAPVHVRFGITLMKILELDERKEKINTLIWKATHWNDPGLAWVPKSHENISDIRIPYNRIWRPDIHAYNIDSEEYRPIFATDAVVQSDGNISLIEPVVFSTTCRVSYVNFPFDHQKCQLKFGSWTHSQGTVDMHLDGDEADISSYVPMDSWKLIGAAAQKNTIQYACCPDAYIDVSIMIHIQREGGWILTASKRVNTFVIVVFLISFIMTVSSVSKIIFALMPLLAIAYQLNVYNTNFPLFAQQEDKGLHWDNLIAYFKLLWTLAIAGLIVNTCTYCIYKYTGSVPRFVDDLLSYKISRALQSDRVEFRQHRLHSDGLDTIELGTNIIHSAEERRKQGRNGWQSVAAILDRCFCIIFVLIALLIWVAMFPSLRP